MAEALNILKHWRTKYDCAIAVVHHYRKGQGTGVERLYGSQALYSWSENNLFVTRKEGQQTTVTIERDIKDSKRLEGLIDVRFDDIDEEYLYQVAIPEAKDKSGPKPVGYTALAMKMLDHLKQYKVGQVVRRAEIQEILNMNTRTVTQCVTKFEEDGFIETFYDKNSRGEPQMIRIVGDLHNMTMVDKVEQEGCIYL